MTEYTKDMKTLISLGFSVSVEHLEFDYIRITAIKDLRTDRLEYVICYDNEENRLMTLNNSHYMGKAIDIHVH